MVRSRLLFFLFGVLVVSHAFAVTAEKDPIQKDIPTLCRDIEKAFQKRNWGQNPCQNLNWKFEETSVQGRPLIYIEFGRPEAKNVTLFLSMVHGDEVTPLYFGFEMARWANANMAKYPDSKIVIAPFINPDGFFVTPKTRTNANGVDCNRNFHTSDWDKSALTMWKKKYRSDKRRFPGFKAESEPETAFQKNLIEKFKPQKILSIHSPLNFMDYDGPDHLSFSKFGEEYIQKCIELQKKVKARSGGFYPGSLGNFAGQELGIPTITLELPSVHFPKAIEYWGLFKTGIETVITYEVPKP